MAFEQLTKQSACFSFTSFCVTSLRYAHVTKISLDLGAGPLSRYFDIPTVELFKISYDDRLLSEPTTEVNGNNNYVLQYIKTMSIALFRDMAS